MARLFSIIWMGPNAITAVLMRERQREIPQIAEEGQCDHRDRDWSDEATRQAML